MDSTSFAVETSSLEVENKENEPQRIEQDNIYVCFKLSNEEYAVDIKYIQEVIRIPRITHIPQMPDYVLGCVNIRGKILPVFDIRQKLCLPIIPINQLTKLLVVRVEETQISFIIDEVLDNVKLSDKEIDPVPKIKMHLDSKCISGIGVLKGRMIVIANLIKIHKEIIKDIHQPGV